MTSSPQERDPQGDTESAPRMIRLRAHNRALSQWCEPLGDDGQRTPVGIELRHLAALEAVGQTRSFRAAADALGYVQSAVSHQIAALERLVGSRLVERSRGNAPVSLTRAGELLLEHAEEIVSQFRAAQVKLAALEQGRAGSLRVGAFQSVAANVLPRIMAVFARSHPEFRVIPSETHDDSPLFDLLEGGLLDLCFCELPYDDDRFEGIELIEDPFVLMVSQVSPLARMEDPPALAEIARMPLVGFNASRSQERMLTQLAATGSVPRFALRTDLNPTLQSFVASDIGVAVVPYLTVDPLHTGTTVLPLEGIEPRTISLIWDRARGCPPAAREFAETARSVSPRFRRAASCETPPLPAAA